MLHAETSGTEPESERPVLWMHTELRRWWFHEKFCSAKNRVVTLCVIATPPRRRRTDKTGTIKSLDSYAGHPPWAHHRKYRAWEGQDHRRHGHRPTRSRARHAGADAAISQRIVALRGTRCGAGIWRPVRDEADGARLREGRPGKA